MLLEVKARINRISIKFNRFIQENSTSIDKVYMRLQNTLEILSNHKKKKESIIFSDFKLCYKFIVIRAS